MTDLNWLVVVFLLAIGAGFIWWAWGRRAAPADKPKLPAEPVAPARTVAPPPPPAAAPEPLAPAAEPAPKTAEPLAFTGEIPAQEPVTPITPVALAPAPKAKPAAKPKQAAKPATVKAPAAKPKPVEKAPAAPAAKAPATKKAATPAAKVAKAPAAKAPAAKAPAAKPAAKPVAKAPAAKPKAAAAKPATPDNLLQLKGVGPKLVTLLNGLGVNSFAQIAGWNAADVERVDAQLGTFKGRITRDRWIEQAGYLAKGDIAGFEASFGKLDSEN